MNCEDTIESVCIKRGTFSITVSGNSADSKNIPVLHEMKHQEHPALLHHPALYILK